MTDVVHGGYLDLAHVDDCLRRGVTPLASLLPGFLVGSKVE